MSGPTRRAALGGLGLALAAPLAAHGAGDRLTKAQAHYQYAPKGAQRCGLCASFLPGADPAAPGACRLVEGEIPPTGWCELYGAR